MYSLSLTHTLTYTHILCIGQTTSFLESTIVSHMYYENKIIHSSGASSFDSYIYIILQRSHLSLRREMICSPQSPLVYMHMYAPPRHMHSRHCDTSLHCRVVHLAQILLCTLCIYTERLARAICNTQQVELLLQ